MCPGPDTLSSCSAIDGALPRSEASLSSQETGKLVGRDTDVRKFRILNDNTATMPRESSSEIVNTENVEKTISDTLYATDKGKAVENEQSLKWKNMKSKFQDSCKKHAVIASGIIFILFCLRLIL